MLDANAIVLPVQNRGFNRLGLEEVPDSPTRAELERNPEPQLFWGAREQRPWSRLQWWESELYAAQGIEDIAKKPFLVLPQDWRTSPPTRIAVRTSTLYMSSIKAREKRRITETAQYVSAMVRQAREFYAAADSMGVTDLSRPLLYFYGALALAKAATATIFGRNQQEERYHGLTFGKTYGPSVRHEKPGWPTVIEWQSNGAFVRLYRAARWDADIYQGSMKESGFAVWSKRNGAPPRFHILECLRWLGSEWALLPKTGFEWEWPNLRYRTDREKCLLLYNGPDDMFMKRDLPPDRLLFQVPVVAVQYMVLYYFSILARYYGLEWQRLLSATTEPEGYVFRVALEEVAYRFLLSVWHLLPRIGDETMLALPAPLPPFSPKRPDLKKWYHPPVERRAAESEPVTEASS